MIKSVFVNLDDDIGKIVAKVRNESAPELILVVPKRALLFSPFTDLKALRSRLEQLGKRIYFFTMDAKGQQRLTEAGFNLKNPDTQRAGRLEMEFKTRKRSAHTLKHFPQSTEKPKTSGNSDSEAVTDIISAVETGPMSVKHATALGAMQDVQPPRLLPRKPQLKHKPVMRILKTVLVAGVLILLALVTIILPEARVTVYARTQPIARDIQILVDTSQTFDPQRLILHGEILDSNEEKTKQFEATGQVNVGNKAQGTVQIYNFTGRSYRLNTDTTKLTVGNKSYRFQKDASGIRPTAFFPGTQDVNPETLSPEIQVIAELPGEDSNLPAGTRLEIHNEVLGSLPQVLYAKVNKSIEGGTSRFRTVISPADIENAKKNLSSDLLVSIRQQLSNSRGLTILDTGSDLQIKNITFDKNPGDQALNFLGTITGRITALAFDQAMLKDMIEQRIGLTLDPNKYLVTDQHQKIVQSFKSLDLQAGKGVLNVHVESLVSTKIDTQGIAGKINGKTPLEIKELLLSDPEVEGVDIVLKPFWVKSVPKFSGKVYVFSKLSAR